MTSFSSNPIERVRWNVAQAKGQALVTTKGVNECQVDFHFFGVQWRARAFGMQGLWLLRALHPEMLPWLPINEANTNGIHQIHYPAIGPCKALLLAKESIFQFRYFKDTPIFHECNADYRLLLKRMATAPTESADAGMYGVSSC